ncbi:MAG TPA: hypothetical protein VG842_10230, partial [Sediminibacterium sp.]|nr:hypothetical protein [Sediminibacterium sp.]
MKQFCLYILLLLGGFSAREVNGQTRSFDSYTNELLFNVFRDKPDTAISEFIRLYVPELLKKNTKPAFTGTAGQQRVEEVHSFVFKRHPFFNGKFAVGKLQFFCTRFIPANTVAVYDISLVLEFDDQVSAEQ